MVGLPYGMVCGRISDLGFDELLVEVEWNSHPSGVACVDGRFLLPCEVEEGWLMRGILLW